MICGAVVYAYDDASETMSRQMFARLAALRRLSPSTNKGTSVDRPRTAAAKMGKRRAGERVEGALARTETADYENQTRRLSL